MKNIFKEFETIKNYYSPKIVGEVNDQYIKLAVAKGDDIPWHNHEHEDELFYIIKGSLLMEIEHQDPQVMSAGDMIVIPKGVNHRVSAEEECHIMLVESKTTKHTGDVVTDITKSIDEQRS